jgi:hypothetical protein
MKNKYRFSLLLISSIILKHEIVHWEQYKRMGLLSFYYNYLKYYLNSGRMNNWMEDEARNPCKGKRH